MPTFASTQIWFQPDPEDERVAVRFVNVTGHSLTFVDPQDPARTISVPPSGIVISADPVERVVGSLPGPITLVALDWQPEAFALAALDQIERACRAAGDPFVVVGSLPAAQAYPGRVLNMVPLPGLARVPPSEKRMYADRFTTFADA